MKTCPSCQKRLANNKFQKHLAQHKKKNLDSEKQMYTKNKITQNEVNLKKDTLETSYIQQWSDKIKKIYNKIAKKTSNQINFLHKKYQSKSKGIFKNKK